MQNYGFEEFELTTLNRHPRHTHALVALLLAFYDSTSFSGFKIRVGLPLSRRIVVCFYVVMAPLLALESATLLQLAKITMLQIRYVLYLYL